MNFPCFEIFIFVLKDMKTTSLLVQSVLQEYQVFPRLSGRYTGLHNESKNTLHT